MLWLMSIRCSSGKSTNFFWLSATGLGASEALMNRLTVLTGQLRSIAFISSSRLPSSGACSCAGLQRISGTGCMNQSSADTRTFSRFSSSSGVSFFAPAILRSRVSTRWILLVSTEGRGRCPRKFEEA